MRRFSVQRRLFRPGTLDGVVSISNSFLAQCRQKPASSARPACLTYAESDTPPHASAFDVVNGLLRFRASLVIRIDIGRTNDAAAVDHEPSRRRQGPAGLAVAYREVIAKAEMNRLQTIGQFESQTVSPADVIHQSERARARKGKLSSIR